MIIANNLILSNINFLYSFQNNIKLFIFLLYNTLVIIIMTRLYDSILGHLVMGHM